MKNISFRNDVLPLKNVLYRLALRITLNKEEAEDIVQDTLMKVWNRRDSLQNVDSIEAFSLTICRNLSLDRMKRAGNDSQPIGDEEIGSADTASDPYERMIQKDRFELVKRTLTACPRSKEAACSCATSRGKATKRLPLFSV